MTARDAALTALERCRRDGAWSGPTVDALLRSHGLGGREAALASRMCLGVLQNSLYLDFLIDSFCSTRSGRLEPKVLDILRLGAYQILFLDRIPDRAAVHESVALCRRTGYSRAAGLVNAVLRRLSENRDRLPAVPGEGSAAYLSVRYSHPQWLVERLISQRGYETAAAFFAANNVPPELSVAINTLRIEPDELFRAWDRAGIRYARCDYPPHTASVSGGSPTTLPGFDEGLFYVQDRAACAAAEIAAPRPGMRVLDACAAPGGKSFAAAIRMEDHGSILACDIHEKKRRLIEDGAARLGISILSTQTQDARRLREDWRESFDLVIGDVPCSGFGVIRKKPEIRWRKEETSAQLPQIQREILDTLSSYVRPGGVLLYSTCTVLREENEEIVTAFLEKHPEFRPEDFAVGERDSIHGCYTFWPHIDGTDGFFVAKLRRIL